jgi:pyruvate dehydrogenase E2 component (dihydrolipoamide acetyltransferase)
MALVSVRIPQIGEGLQEARLVALLKQPGDTVKRDEPIYQMETDKAVMDVESPYDGRLVEWLGKPDDIFEIGAEVARMEVAASVDTPVDSGAPLPAATIPPRTRAYAREKGVADDVLALIPATSGKLMPEDVDRYLSGDRYLSEEHRTTEPPAGTRHGYSEQPLPAKQRLLASRLVRGAHLVVPGTISIPARWEGIEHARARYVAAGGDFRPSTFTMFAFAVTQALKEYPAFRSSLVGEDRLRTYAHVSLGIAVSLPEDELVVAVVEEADTLSWEAFAERARERIELARTGKDQANESVTLSLTNMQAAGLRDAVPVVAPPAVGTLFLGATYHDLDPESETPKVRRVANLVLTFDHRVINGVGAAQFLGAVRDKVETIGSLL